MDGCSQLTSFPVISKNIEILILRDTAIEDVPPSVAEYFFRLEHLNICGSLKRLTHVPLCIMRLHLTSSDIERIPDCVIGLTHLVYLNVSWCRKLKSISGLPSSLNILDAIDCLSLKSVCFLYPIRALSFTNCLKLDEETRRGIIQKSNYDYVCLPGTEIPAEFTHKAKGRSITIPLAPGTLSASSWVKACILILPYMLYYPIDRISCSITSRGVRVNELEWYQYDIGSEHLLISHFDLFGHEVDVTMSEITFEFNHKNLGAKIIECGLQIMTEEAEGSSSWELDNFGTESSSSEVDCYETGGNTNNHTDEDEDEDGDYEAED